MVTDDYMVELDSNADGEELVDSIADGEEFASFSSPISSNLLLSTDVVPQLLFASIISV